MPREPEYLILARNPEFRALVEAARGQERTPAGHGRPALARRFRVNPNTVQAAQRRVLAELAGEVAPQSVSLEAGEATESSEVQGDNWTITLPKTPIHTLEALLEHCRVDRQVWEVERWVCNAYATAAKDAAGELQTQQLYQVKAWLRRNRRAEALRTIFAEQIEDCRRHAPVYAPIPYPQREGGVLFEPSLYDSHFGKLCWSEETGGANYDLRIARALYRHAVAYLLDRARSYPVERICYVVGNDLFHFDNLIGTTTKGTPQDQDGRYAKVFRTVRESVVEAVELMRQVAPVDVVMIAGNHDTQSVWCLGDSLQCWFRNCPDVTVDNRPLLRKAYAYGKVLLMFTHGDKGKLKDLPLQLAVDERELWARARHCEIHTGDKHKAHLEEHKGVRVRIIPSMCSPDAWHAANLFTGSIRSAEGYLWDPEHGLLGTMHYNLPSGYEPE